MAYDEDAHITVIRGDPDAAELAAVTAVLCALRNRARRTAEEGTGLPRATWGTGRGRFRPAVMWSADPHRTRGSS